MWSPSAAGTSLQDKSSTIWINRQRFGDVGGQRLGGFVGGAWAQQGKEALAWGWGGGWRRWRCVTSFQDKSEEVWTEIGAISGHSGPVRSLDWSPCGNYLISVGYLNLLGLSWGRFHWFISTALTRLQGFMVQLRPLLTIWSGMN